jgi:hypothetical protein
LIGVTSKTNATGAWWYNVFCKIPVLVSQLTQEQTSSHLPWSLF